MTYHPLLENTNISFIFFYFFMITQSHIKKKKSSLLSLFTGGRNKHSKHSICINPTSIPRMQIYTSCKVLARSNCLTYKYSRAPLADAVIANMSSYKLHRIINISSRHVSLQNMFFLSPSASVLYCCFCVSVSSINLFNQKTLFTTTVL